MGYHVFISYRRQGASELALLLYKQLKEDGYSPFLDLKEMASGHFDNQLYDRIAECSDVLVLLPPDAFAHGKGAEDWFYNEISYALRAGKNVIPVMMRGFEWPKEKDPVVEQLHYRQGLEVSTEYFDAMFAKLCRLITYKPETKKKHLITAAVAIIMVAFAGFGLYSVFSNGLPESFGTTSPGTHLAETATPGVHDAPPPAPTSAADSGVPLENMYVQAIRECTLFEEIGSWEGYTPDAETGEVFTYDGETVTDENGLNWYSVDYFGITCWISAEDSILVNSEQAVRNHPTFFESLMWGIEERGSSHWNEQTEEWVLIEGYNERGSLVDWFVECYASPFVDKPNAAAPKVLSCSWTSELQEGGRLQDEEIWQMVLEGKTVSGSGFDSMWPADIEELSREQLVSRIYLPDDPSIEGRQSIVYRSGNDTFTFTFDLVYAGGYTGSGLGWKAENVEISR